MVEYSSELSNINARKFRLLPRLVPARVKYWLAASQRLEGDSNPEAVVSTRVALPGILGGDSTIEFWSRRAKARMDERPLVE